MRITTLGRPCGPHQSPRGRGTAELMPDSQWVEGLCPRPALVTPPSLRAWKVLFATTSVPARLSLCLLGGISGSGTQSAQCGVAPACHQGSQVRTSFLPQSHPVGPPTLKGYNRVSSFLVSRLQTELVLGESFDICDLKTEIN